MHSFQLHEDGGREQKSKYYTTCVFLSFKITGSDALRKGDRYDTRTDTYSILHAMASKDNSEIVLLSRIELQLPELKSRYEVFPLSFHFLLVLFLIARTIHEICTTLVKPICHRMNDVTYGYPLEVYTRRH